MDMAISDFQPGGVGRAQPMICCVWACKAGKYVAWAEFHGFMAAPVAQVKASRFSRNAFLESGDTTSF